MKRWNGRVISDAAHFSPSASKVTGAEPKRKTKSEYTESIRVKAEERQADVEAAEKGKIKANNTAVQEVYDYLGQSGETTLGALSRNLSFSVAAIERISEILVKTDLAMYGRIAKRNIKTIYLTK